MGNQVSGVSRNYGGGMYNQSNSSPSLTNCSFVGNQAAGVSGGNNNGGGMYNQSSSPSLTNCSFVGNRVSGGSGSDNFGGGMYNLSTSPSLTNCSFVGNSASDEGGAINYQNATARLVNCAFVNNQCNNGNGGAIFAFATSLTVLNSSFQSNSASSGGAINTFNGVVNLTNSVVFGNGGSNTFINQVNNGQPSGLTVSYSLLETSVTSYTSSPTNLTTTTSPFASTTGVALNSCAAAIDAGDPNTTTATVGTTDLAGNPRLVRRLDMGAVEFQATPNYPVAITRQPAAGLAVCVGGAVTASVSVSGTDPYTYQWYKNGAPLSPAQSTSSLSLNSLTSTDAGSYSVVITNTCNSVTSTAFSLTVNALSPDYQPLADLYNATNGASWTNKGGWLQGCDPCTGNGGNPWYGLTCSGGRVTQIGLSSNELSGSIPASLGNLINLSVLYLFDNQLSGSIPASLGNLTNLQGLYLTNNQLSGSIPVSLGSLTNLQFLLLNSNQLTGGIPSSLGNLTNLQQLRLNANQLSGCYPVSLSALCGISKNFRNNAGLPDGGSDAGFTAFCTTGQGSDAFVAQATASVTNALVGSVVSLSTSGGTSYTWTAPAGAVLSGTSGSAVSATLTTAGVQTFTVVVSFGGTCSQTATVSVTAVDPTPTITGFAASPSAVCVGSPVTFTATVGNVSLPYGYTLSNSQSTTTGTASSTALSQNLTASGSGVQPFTLTVSSSGQTVSATASLTVNALPIAGLTNNGPLTCAQTSVTLTASGGSSYTFTNGESVLGTPGSASTVVVNRAGTYLVVVANESGCVSSTSTTVSSATTVVTATLSASPSTTLTCAQTSLTLTAGGAVGVPGNAYTFSGPGVVSQSGNMAVVNASGVYSVSVTNTATGCFSVTSISISQDASVPVASLVSSGTLSCAVTSVTLTATPTGQSYRFSAGASQLGSSNQATVSSPGLYSVTVINGGNGCTGVASVSVSQNNTAPVATISASPSTTLSCTQTSLTLTAGGGNAYTFSANVASQSGSTALVNASGVYSVTVTNTSTGCFSVTSITISQDASTPVASLVSSGTLSCAVTSVTLTASPTGLSYVFSGPGVVSQNSNTAVVNASGTYSVTVSNGNNGCSSVASVSVSQDNTAPMVRITVNPSLTITQGQSATLTAAGGAGQPANTYIWSTGANSTTIVASVSGPYSVTGTAANGCTGTASVTLTVMPVMSGPFAITGVSTLSCTPILPNRFSVSFTPRYDGLNGQPVSFSVVSELLPTTNAGPYSLQLYTDNPVITLRAVQSGVATQFAYNWLDACRTTTAPNTPPRVVMGIPSQTATVGQPMSYVIPSGTFTDDETPTSLQLSARGVPAGLRFAGSTLSGTLSTTVGSPFSLTITATDPGGLSVSTLLQLTVLPDGSTPPPPPPTSAFSITGVTTISCTPVANRISLSFAPRYAGVNGQPIAFEVINESLPTTDPGPYSLTLYRDNSVITLLASQTGSSGPVSFAYNWLAACQNLGQENTPPRLNEPVGSQTAVVGQTYSLNLFNTFIDQETPNQISLSASGLPAGLTLSGKIISGTPSVSGVSSVTLTATDGGGLSTSTTFTITVVPAPVTPPPPTSTFSITGVQTVRCEVLSAGQRRVTFSPQYGGLDGRPVSFSVLNELVPTTAPGPYVLTLYTDNPVIKLSAVQSGVSSQFSYGWLSACNPGARLSAEPVGLWVARVVGNPVNEQLVVEITGAAGQHLALTLVDGSGQAVSHRAVPSTTATHREVFDVHLQAGGLLLLQVTDGVRSQTLKVIKQ